MQEHMGQALTHPLAAQRDQVVTALWGGQVRAGDDHSVRTHTVQQVHHLPAARESVSIHTLGLFLTVKFPKGIGGQALVGYCPLCN